MIKYNYLKIQLFSCFMGLGCFVDIAYADEFIWLEDVYGEDSKAWVEAESQKTLKAFESHDVFKKTKQQALDILNASDKLPFGSIKGDFVYNFWQDERHVKGLWRRQTLKDFIAQSNTWQTVLDIDALNLSSKSNFVFKGAQCLEPDGDRCLVMLSDGGKDAVTIREFDLKTLGFVNLKPFDWKESKTSLDWIDQDKIAIASDFGADTLTDSGYAREVRLWQRGKAAPDAEPIFRGQKEDTWVRPHVIPRTSSEGLFLIERGIDFYRRQYFVVDAEKGKPRQLPLPEKAEIEGYIQNRLLITLKEPWRGFSAGSLLSLAWDDKAPVNDAKDWNIQALFVPNDTKFLNGVTIALDYVALTIMEHVNLSVAVLSFDKGIMVKESSLSMPAQGTSKVFGGSMHTNLSFLTHENLTTPPSLYMVDFKSNATALIKAQPARFDATNLTTNQYFAKSKDGTKVPYFIVMNKNTPITGTQPTLQYGYGGFEIALLPTYKSIEGKVWLERGGVYVIANIRGGGEYGPTWHEAALRDKRWRAFEDFFAVSEDLIARGITSPKHLGIMGGSNGGLLMGVALTQRPDLYNAVVCMVPLLDMERFHKLLAGASWMAEYGNPEVSADRKFLLEYSPYHNLNQKTQYPEALIMTSTRDDRVHPGHARKMAAKMSALGHKRHYYENTQGGHSASADNTERAAMIALQYSYLANKLNLNKLN